MAPFVVAAILIAAGVPLFVVTNLRRQVDGVHAEVVVVEVVQIVRRRSRVRRFAASRERFATATIAATSLLAPARSAATATPATRLITFGARTPRLAGFAGRRGQCIVGRGSEIFGAHALFGRQQKANVRVGFFVMADRQVGRVQLAIRCRVGVAVGRAALASIAIAAAAAPTAPATRSILVAFRGR